MNIRELNEAIDKALNETSPELKAKVLARRKEQAERAKAKLDRSIKLMAKQGISAPEEVTLKFKSYYWSTTEDNYKDGAIPRSYGADWDRNRFKEVKIKLNPETIAHDIMEAAREYTLLFWADDYCGVFEDENRITFCCEGNDNNEEPSEEEWEEFKAGERNLWIIDANITYEIDEQERPYFIETCKKAKMIDMY